MSVDPLRPMPMSPLEIASLVERTRAAQVATQTAQAERAARYARRCKVPVAQAARRFSVHPNRAQAAWHRLYPDVPMLARKRGG